ncbi:acetyltransferase [Bordetella pertussis]|nr:acetyltransferase [Bordetella pertussis]
MAMSEQDHRAWIAAGTSWVAECPGAGLAGFLVAERTADALHVWELAVRREGLPAARRCAMRREIAAARR